MSALQLETDPKVAEVFAAYPEPIRDKLLALRKLVLEAAQELDEVSKLVETLKWGEPSYLTQHGSTLRMDWKEKTPEQYAVYFKCTSLLVPTFKMVYPEVFTYETTRAIAFGLKDIVPKKELKDCLKAALRYHKVKKLPRLGMG